jgi:predicted permease
MNTYVLVVIAIWELIWKGIALWKSARHSQRNWFVAILVFNTIGILPIAYIYFFQKKKPSEKKEVPEKKEGKKKK